MQEQRLFDRRREREGLDPWLAIPGPNADGSSHVAIMQEEPLVLFTDGQRGRLRVTSDGGRLLSFDLFMVQPGSDDGMREFTNSKGETICGRNRNEAELIPIALRELTKRRAV